MGIAYIYFDYNDRQSQTQEQVVESLIKQLANQLDTLPLCLELIKNKSTRENSRPTISDLMECFISCVNEFSSTFLLFDAVDERDEGQQDEVLSMIRKLSLSGARVMMTSRTHIMGRLMALTEKPLVIEIEARKLDIERYIIRKLKTKCLDDVLKHNIIKIISTRAQGM